MSTNSAIGLLADGGEVVAVYCHWDGYTRYNGAVLNTFYNTEEKVIELLAQGDISALGSSIGEKHDFSRSSEYVNIVALNTEVATECTFYNRDRGEKTAAVTLSDRHEFLDHFSYRGAEYFYLFAHGEWLVSTGGLFEPLSVILRAPENV